MISDNFVNRSTRPASRAAARNEAMTRVDRALVRAGVDPECGAGVPRLDITVDDDHLSWLNEQNRLSQLRKLQYNKSRCLAIVNLIGH